MLRALLMYEMFSCGDECDRTGLRRTMGADRVVHVREKEVDKNRSRASNVRMR